MNENQFLDFIRLTVSNMASQKKAAAAFGISPQFLSDILHGRRRPTERIANALGYIQMTFYEPISNAPTEGE